MSAKRRLTVGVVYGSRSVEHDVSVVTANQVMRALSSEKFDIVPLYITREGLWFTGEILHDLSVYKDEDLLIRSRAISSVMFSPNPRHHGIIIDLQSRFFSRKVSKRLDVIFPAVHGSHGEDGTLQGLFELSDIPYVGCGVMASAIANDKLMTKLVLKANDIPVVRALAFDRQEWLDAPSNITEKVGSTLRFPVFVKPVTLGSSIGVAKVDDAKNLGSYIDLAFNFDSRVLVEEAVVDAIEINCSVMGNGKNIRASVLEQPISWQQFLTYEEKYLSGTEGMKSAERIIPAPIEPTLANRIQELAVSAFKAIQGRGIARIDFLVRLGTGEVFLNEINTMPGSISFYLWHHMGMSAADVVEELILLAQETSVIKRSNQYNYRTSLIEQSAARGIKGIKGSKGLSGSIK